LRPTHPAYTRLLHSDVILVDEFSMMTALFLAHAMYQMNYVSQSAGQTDASEKLIIFLGDPAQLPSVCQHSRKHVANEESHDVCRQCHLSNSAIWRSFTRHSLTRSMRHAGDPPLMTFLDIIRARKPTQEEIDTVLSECVLPDTSAAVAAYCAVDNVTVLCTHVEDVAYYNTRMLMQRFPPLDIVATPLNTNATGVAGLQHWVEDYKFHTLFGFAPGARIMLTENLDMTIGAANGAVGTVASFARVDTTAPTSAVKAVKVLLDSGSTLQIRETKATRTSHEQQRYAKSTFPLQLAYAMTAHKSQGATLCGSVLLHVRSIFAPGQMYVMLSRVLKRTQLRLVRRLTPADFIPIPADLLD
jgi:ATP-dependent exoDNAse (exonuclease V) alpha subunit